MKISLYWRYGENWASCNSSPSVQGISRTVWLLGAGIKDDRDGWDPIRSLVRGLMGLIAPSPDLKDLLDRPPRGLEDWIKENVDQWVPGRTTLDSQ